MLGPVTGLRPVTGSRDQFSGDTSEAWPRNPVGVGASTASVAV